MVRFITILREGTTTTPREIINGKNVPFQKKTKCKNKRVDFPFHTTSAPRDHYFIGEGKHALEGLRPFT